LYLIRGAEWMDELVRVGSVELKEIWGDVIMC
jgi:hypothetical protein